MYRRGKAGRREINPIARQRYPTSIPTLRSMAHESCLQAVQLDPTAADFFCPAAAFFCAVPLSDHAGAEFDPAIPYINSALPFSNTAFV
jgi:hypothetical protein